MKLIRPLLHFVLYSNVFIAICAYALAWQTLELYPIVGYHVKNSILWFIFFATLTTYALHRIIGLYRLHPFLNEGRYSIIDQYKAHIWVYALIGAVGAAFTFIKLSHRVQGWIIVPALLAMGYVFPLFGRGRYRLRDYSGVKIFLVAGVWSWVTAVLPMVSSDMEPRWEQLMPLFLERFCYIFAATLAFDIRDMRVDTHNQVRTLPSILGVRWSLVLAVWLLVLASVLAYQIHMPEHALAVTVVYAITGLMVVASPRFVEQDYYFTGGIDGTMILHAVAIIIANAWYAYAM